MKIETVECEYTVAITKWTRVEIVIIVIKGSDFCPRGVVVGL